MSIATSQAPELATIRDDIAALKHDVTSLIEHLKTSASDGAQTAATQLADRSRRLRRTASDQSTRAIAVASRQVEKQPLLALLTVLCVGYIGGRLLWR